MNDLLDDLPSPLPARETMAEGAVLLRGFARDRAEAVMDEVTRITAVSPFRHMTTPGGFRMSVAMTNCGRVGWISDRKGYRYDPVDPETGRGWPPLPPVLLDLARTAATEAGFADFAPDVCLINRYAPGTRLSLHQDKDERDMSAPIVSVSIGLPAVFLFGGTRRADRPRRFRLDHGDVAVWGGAARLAYHGIAPLAEGEHRLTGRHRINLTFRNAL
jgi:alkylated DNA repair protein (DNA oxidative demethylase)